MLVTDAEDALYVADEDERQILLTIVAGQVDRQVNLHFRCSNDCCKYDIVMILGINTVHT